LVKQIIEVYIPNNVIRLKLVNANGEVLFNCQKKLQTNPKVESTETDEDIDYSGYVTYDEKSLPAAYNKYLNKMLTKKEITTFAKIAEDLEEKIRLQEELDILVEAYYNHFGRFCKSPRKGGLSN
jgi:hypothetical protein